MLDFHPYFKIDSNFYNKEKKELTLECQFLFDEDIVIHVIPYLQAHPEIESLNLNRNEIGIRGAKVLAQIKTLKKLNLSNNKLGADGAAAFANNETLLELNISYNKIGNNGAIALSKNKTLQKLNVHFNYIEAGGAKALALNKNLLSLDIGLNYIKISGAVALAANFNLTVIAEAFSHEVGDDKIKSIREKLKNAYVQGATIGALSLGKYSNILPPEITKRIGFFLENKDSLRIIQTAKRAKQLAEEEKELCEIAEGRDLQFKPDFL